MAQSMMGMAAPSVATSMSSTASSNTLLRGSRLTSLPATSTGCSPIRLPLLVTCSSNKAPSPPSLTDLQEGVDRATKHELQPADIERHQAETTSEKQSIVGSIPTSTTPWPRPELERRPETGDRSLASLFAIDGAAPETINGRMARHSIYVLIVFAPDLYLKLQFVRAMVGFVWALVAEKLTGLGVVEQLFNPSTSGILWFGAVVQLFTLATIIPFANGESTDARSWGPFNAKAERWNGRLAMLGFAALVIDEMVRQTPFLHR